MSIKPTTSVGKHSRDGRHDPCIVPRVIPVLEAMVGIVLADCWLLDRAFHGDRSVAERDDRAMSDTPERNDA